jgi:hypothetical protein
MLACICGGMFEILGIGACLGISALASFIVGKFSRKKCCDHECSNSNDQIS